MRRRALLRRLGTGAGLGAAGCLSAPPAGTERTDTATGTATPRAVDRTADGTPATTTTPDGLPRRVAVETLSDAPLRAAYAVAASATVTEPRVTTDHTATVRVTLSNRGERDRALTYPARECGLNALFGTQFDGEGRVVLAPVDLEWTREHERCWRAPYRNVSCGIPVVPKDVALPAGESVTWRFALWAMPEAPCMPPGRYRFRRAFTADRRTPAEDAPTLSLTLAVARPDA